MDDDDGDHALARLSHTHIRRAYPHLSLFSLLFLFAVAVLFTMEDSSKVFANWQHRAGGRRRRHSRRAPRHWQLEREVPLRQLLMSQRSNGVFINDPKGPFILRWYREVVKGDGLPPQTARATRTERASTTS